MDPQGNAVGQDGERGKATRGRRSWSKVEEDTLILCLTEIVNDGWKAENGFKVGFQRELEKCMRKMLPGTDIVANPHINSKIHVWKKEYSVLSDLLSKSGIGWNSSSSMIEVDDEDVWDASRRIDPHIKNLRYKSWPYYSQWLEIFGKDRATGENAVDPIDLANELIDTKAETEGENCEKLPSNKPDDVNDGVNIVCKPMVDGVNSVSKGKKRKMVDPDVSMLVETLGEFMKQSNASISDVARGGGGSMDHSFNTKKLTDIMDKVVGLKLTDKLKVCDELVQNTKRLELFMNLTAEEQSEYVWMLLDSRL